MKPSDKLRQLQNRLQPAGTEVNVHEHPERIPSYEDWHHPDGHLLTWRPGWPVAQLREPGR